MTSPKYEDELEIENKKQRHKMYYSELDGFLIAVIIIIALVVVAVIIF